MSRSYIHNLYLTICCYNHSYIHTYFFKGKPYSVDTLQKSESYQDFTNIRKTVYAWMSKYFLLLLTVNGLNFKMLFEI